MCNCIATTNDALCESNTCLVLSMMIDMKGGKTRTELTVPTKRINSKIRKGPLVVVANYCPFCGEKVTR